MYIKELAKLAHALQYLLCKRKLIIGDKKMKYAISKRNPEYGLENFFNDFFDGAYTTKMPPVDVYENKDSYTVEAEIAGYSPEDVKLSVDKHILTIKAESDKKEEEKNEKKYMIKETYHNSFSRSFTLPDDVDEEKISAETKNGVLKVTLPKKPAEPEKGKIEIKIN